MNKLAQVIRKYFIITIGSAMIGFSLSCFLAPNEIIPGGVSGIATVMNNFINIPIGTIILLLNIPIFIWGIVKLGKGLGVATVYGTVTLSLFANIFSVIGQLTDDLILASVFGGLIDGVGFGLVFYVNATTGGIDIAAKIIKNKFRHLQLGKIIVFIDIFIILFAMIIYKNVNIGLYSIITFWISSYILDFILEGFNFAKLSIIISDKYDEISHIITTKLERGATLLYGKGAYTGNSKNVIMCTIKKNEIPTLKDIIKSVDENAFVLITDAKEVLGEGF